MTAFRLIAAANAFLLALASSGAAQDSSIAKLDGKVTDLVGKDARLILGGGLGAITQPYVGADSVRFVPEPLIIYQRERLEFVGRTLGYELWSNEGFHVKAIAQWRFFGHDAGADSEFLRGMEERLGTGEVGLRTEFEFDRGQVSLAAVADVLSRHGGYEVEARASFELSTWRPLSVKPNGGVRFQSSSLTDYYFGVDPEEAVFMPCASSGRRLCEGAVDRLAYEVDAAVVPFAGVMARQSLTPKVAVVGGFDLTVLDESVRDSPIVDESVQAFGFLGLIYLFGNASAADAGE